MIYTSIYLLLSIVESIQFDFLSLIVFILFDLVVVLVQMYGKKVRQDKTTSQLLELMDKVNEEK